MSGNRFNDTFDNGLREYDLSLIIIRLMRIYVFASPGAGGAKYNLLAKAGMLDRVQQIRFLRLRACLFIKNI